VYGLSRGLFKLGLCFSVRTNLIDTVKENIFDTCFFLTHTKNAIRDQKTRTREFDLGSEKKNKLVCRGIFSEISWHGS
jgi:hypothetical protein